MKTEIERVEKSLKEAFQSASNIFVDPHTQECEVFISVDEYQGELNGTILTNGVSLKMVDYCDTYPFKYIFNYSLKA
jgi:hypothetical protein